MILLMFLLSLPARAATGDFFGDLFAPGMNTGARAKLEERYYARQYAAGLPFGLEQTRFDVSIPVATGASYSWRASAFADYDAIHSGATFPNGRLMPNRLWDPGFGISHSRTLDDGRTVGANFTVSSPSDRPFSAGRNLGLNLHFTYKIPQPDGNAWILFLSVSNTRGFLNYVPMPGAAYYFQSGPHLRGLVGIPFVMLIWQPVDPWSVTTFFFPLRTGELRITYGHPGSVQPYALLSYRTRNYLLFDRADSKDRLFVEEGLAQAGLILPLGKGFAVDLAGGQSYGRRYFLAQKATDRTDAPTIRPDNALFASAKLQAFF